MNRFLAWGLACVLAGGVALAQDAEDCKDHPIVGRMPQFHIDSCENRAFDAFAFKVGWDEAQGENRTQTLEGKLTQITYKLNEDAPPTSALQVFRNYENAFPKLNAKVFKYWSSGSAYNYLTAVVSGKGKETWVMLEPSDEEYTLSIVEVEAMVQQVTANAMREALEKDGFIALYITFDSGKAAIRPESQPLVSEIHRLLKGSAGLRIRVEGHTDDTGTPAGNRKLSEARAQAVVDALKGMGVDAARLAAKGWGQEKPIADNRTEEGRAKNRRVELVKQ